MTGALVAAVHDQGGVAVAGFEHQRSDDGVRKKGGATGAIVFGEFGLDAEVFGCAESGQGIVRRTHEQRIDIGKFQTGVIEREQGCACAQIERTHAGRFTDTVSGSADDGAFSTRKFFHADFLNN